MKRQIEREKETKFDEKVNREGEEDEQGFGLGCTRTQGESDDTAGNGRGTYESFGNLSDVAAVDAA